MLGLASREDSLETLADGPAALTAMPSTRRRDPAMDSDPSPALRRRQVGTRLRQLRERAGRSLTEVAAYLDCSAAKVSRMETGRLLARVPDVRNLLDLYEVGEEQRAELLDLVRESREKGWWEHYPDIIKAGFGTFVGLENSASEIWDYTTHAVPGLLQTNEYAYTVQANRVDVAEEAAERYIEVRMARQAILTRPRPPKVTFIVDEAVLHRVSALDSAAGRQQLEHLGRSAGKPNIKVRILPYSAGVVSHLPYTILGFPDPADPKIVYVEGLVESSYETKVEAVAQYVAVYDQMRSLALSQKESLSLIARVAAGRR
jgi:transcriptional regulator with XRE-family HTH domain